MEKDLFRDPWSIISPKSTNNKELYICVSGNSGAGKSTLVKSIAKALFERDKATIAIDEKSLHHPFISSLFFETDSFGFLIQLNFMLQRVMLVQHWLNNKYNIVMERSHLEDVLFIKHLLNIGCINTREYNAYMELWHCLDKRLRHPDLIVFLDVLPATSLSRLQEDETTGRRPREFPNEEIKIKWIYSWHQLYLEQLEELKKYSSTKLLIISEKDDLKDVTRVALSTLGVK